MACLVTTSLLFLATTFLSVNSFSSIPALLWSPDSSMSQFSDVMGVNPIKTDDFFNGYLTPLMDKPAECAVVFIQDKLHTDHFTKYADVYSPDSVGGAFKYIRNLMDNHFSLELPQVSNPYDAVEKLKTSFSGDVHTVKSAKEVEGLNLSNGKKTLIIVHLDPVNGHSDPENVIQQNDATVGAISRHLHKRNVKYNALFTGKSSSDEQAAGVESHRSRRLLAEPNNNGTFLNISNGQIFLFVKEVSVHVQLDGKNFDFNLTVDDNTAKNSTRDNQTAVINLHFPDVTHNGSFYNVIIETEAMNYKDRWVIKRTSMYVEGGIPPYSNISLDNVTMSPGDMDFTIPILYSWHCTDQIMYLDVVRQKYLSSYDGTYVRFQGYQVQPFNIQNNRFFDSQDCVGYFTTGIWMFLFSSIFLISILIFGVLMVLSLSTMDKYDDPKGKTISVAQGTD